MKLYRFSVESAFGSVKAWSALRRLLGMRRKIVPALYRSRSVAPLIAKAPGHDAPAAVAAVNQKIIELARRKP